ncbi:MAG: AmmeMemoRadiSam system protein B [Acidobacteria bacterium]|nr:AmmeMemoRadiSam system protein B [Acidobacteriota bacterium]
MRVRKTSVAGTWYPGSAAALIRDVDAYLAAARVDVRGRVQAIIAPHAGLMFSGPVGAWAYKVAGTGTYDVAFLVGPSHYVGFAGVSVWPDGAFESPLGPALIDAAGAARVLGSPVGQDLPAAHDREHSLEMQLPFLRRVLPDVPIVPMVIGYQTRQTIEALASALVDAAGSRSALFIASTDLSHYFDAPTAASLDREVQAHVTAFDPEGLLGRFEQYPEQERGRYVACGGGAAIAVMLAARTMGARHGRVLKYAHSGEISGDHAAVVGYLAAAFGTFDDAH